MKQHSSQTLRIAAARRGYTFVEFLVAMAVFGVALSGLFPLLTMMSRSLQPYRTVATPPYNFTSTSPARDGNIRREDYAPFSTGEGPTFTRHVWYLTAYDDYWVRRLGATAQLSGGSATASAATTTFQVTYDPDPTTPVSRVAGSVSGTATWFKTSSEPPLLPIQLPVQSPVLFLDNNDSSGVPVDNETDGTGTYTATGWNTNEIATGAFGEDRQRKVASPMGGTSTGPATWQFKILTTGWYSIQATWKDASDQVDDAQYQIQIYRNSVLQPSTPTTIVKQTVAPAGITVSSTLSWQRLNTNHPSGLMSLTKDDIVEVHLSDVRATSNEPGKYVVADAVRIVQNEVKIKSIERSPSGINQINKNGVNVDVTANVSVIVNIPQ